MRKLFLTICFLVCFVDGVSGAEFLVKAKDQWMDSLPQVAVDEMSSEKKIYYESRSHKGDVVMVRPDGWKWGKNERLPGFVVVKVPEISYKDAKIYEASLDEERRTVRERKYQFSKEEIDLAVLGKLDSIQVSQAVFEGDLTEKNGSPGEVNPPKTDLISFLKYKWNRLFPYYGKAYAQSELKKTICPSGCDYTALESCLDDNEQDLTSTGYYFMAEISGNWSGGADDTQVDISGWTTDDSHYIYIYTTGKAVHDGKRYGSSSTAYKLECDTTGSYDRMIVAGEDWTFLVGLQLDFEMTYGHSYSSTFYIGANYVIVEQCIITGSYIERVFAGVNDGARIFYVISNLIHWIGSGFGAEGDVLVKTSWLSGSRTYVINNTIEGVDDDAIVFSHGNNDESYTYNNIVLDVGDTYFSWATAGSGVADHDYNMSGDTSASGDHSLTEETAEDNFADLTEDSEDFHLASDANAIDVGVDMDPPFNYDIDFDDREDEDTWDMGCDEYVAEAPAGRTRRFF